MSQAGLEVQILAEDLLLFIRLPDQQIQLGRLAGLRHIGVGAELHGLHGGRDGAVSGEEDHLGRQGHLLDLLEDLHPSELGHLEIQDEDVEFLVLELVKRLPPMRGHVGAVALPPELGLQHPGKILLIVGNQNPDLALFVAHHPLSLIWPFAAGSWIRTTVPFPSTEWISIRPPWALTIPSAI